jgi:hypothetical protein
MGASASWARDVIATVYRLRVVIATPRIELNDFSCNADLIETCIGKPSTLVEVYGFHNLRHRLLADNSQGGPHVRDSFGPPPSLWTLYSLFGLQVAEKSSEHRGPWPAAEENLMRSRIIWTIVASGGVLIGIGLVHFHLSALQEPSPVEARAANARLGASLKTQGRPGDYTIHR